MNPILEAPKFAFTNLLHQGVRSYLTLLGVVIGIAAIVTLFSLGEGLNNAVNEQFELLGANTIYVIPSSLFSASSASSFSNVKTLSDSVTGRIEKISEVELVLQSVYSIGTLKVGREQSLVYIMGVTPDELQSYVDTGFLDLREGRFFDERDSLVIIIGNQLADDYFDKKLGVGDKVEIDGKSFRIVGVTSPTTQIAGDPASANNSIFVTRNGFEQLFEETDPLFLIVKTNSADDVLLAKEKIDRVLEKEFGRDQKVFVSQTTEQLQEQVGLLIGVIQIVLVGIASISLLVGGVGIANTMIMSVLERTSEIGVMKAVGATNTLVLSVFLLEAGFIGLVGGIIGTLIGYGLAFIIESVSISSGFALSISVNPLVIIGSLFFAVLVGMLAGYFPAKRAAEMDPVEALRKSK